MKLNKFFLLILFFFNTSALANNGVPQMLPFQGRATDVNGNPINYPIEVKFRIYPPTGNCYVYEETFSNITPSAYGVFSILLGTGTTGALPSNLTQVFSNDAGTVLPNSCSANYAPTLGDWRRLELIVDGESMGEQTIGASAYALNSQTLEGKSASDFIAKSGTVSQANLTTLTNASDASSLHNHDSIYVRKDGANSFTGNISTAGNILLTNPSSSLGIGTNTPTADVHIKKDNPVVRIEMNAGAGGSGTLEFKSGSNSRGSIQVSEEANGLKFYSGTTQAMSIDSAGNLILNASMKVSGTIGLGQYTSAQETTMLSTLTSLGASAKGTMWINTTTNTVKYWDGSSVVVVMNTQSPLVLSQITTALGYTPLNKSGDVMTGALSMGGNNLTSVGNLELSASKYFLLGQYSGDPSTVSWGASEKGRTWFNTSSNQVKYWDGSSIQALGVSGAGLTSLGGQTGSTQTFATGTSGSDFSISSSSNTHTFNIPTASSTNRGALSSADWTTFNNKLGTATTFSGDVSGAYSSTSVDKIKGAPVSVSSLTAGNFLKYNGSAWTNYSLASSDITSILGYTPLNKTGDIMTGTLVLSADPTANLGAATKQYVDSAIAASGANYIRIDGTSALSADWDVNGATPGGTRKITGLADPSSSDGAATKNYVDTKLLSKNLPSTPTASEDGKSLRWNNTTSAWEFFTSSSGSVTSVSGVAPIVVGGATSTPIISISDASTTVKGVVQLATNGGTTAATAVQANDSRLNDSRTPTGTASGDLTGTYPNPSLATSGVTAGTYGSASAVSVLTIDAKGRATSATSTPIAITADQIANAAGKYFSYRPNNVACSDQQILKWDNTNSRWICANDAGLTSINSADVTTALGYTPVNKSGDAMTGALSMGGNNLTSVGNLELSASKYFLLGQYSADPSTTGWGVSEKGRTWFNTSSNQMKYWDGSSIQALGVSGAGLTSLGGQTGSTQTFAVNATGTAPAVNSSSNVHTFSIPLASGTGVTSGTISKTDYDNFNTKLTSPLTTKGDLLAHDTTTHVRVPAGTNGQVLTADSSQASGLKWATPTTGTVTAVSSANSYLSVATGSSTPVITANVGTTANTLAAGDDARIMGAVQSSAYAVDVADTTTCLASERPYWNTVSDKWMCSAIGALDASAITTGTIGTARLGAGSADNTTYLRGDGTWAVPSTISGLTTGYLPKAISATSVGNSVLFEASGKIGIGTTTPVTKLEVVGGIKIGTEASSCSVSFAGTLRYNSGNVEYCNGSSWQAFGISGAGLTSLGGQTGSTQTFATGTSGSDFSISSSSNTHTFNIPTASSTNRGALSSADWTTFNNKLGTATTFSGDVSGAYNSTSVDKIKGKTISAVSYSSGQTLRYDGTNWVNTTLDFADLSNKPTTLSGYGITNALSSTLNNGQILVGNSSNVATAVTLSGDATLSNTGVISLKNTGTAGTYAKVTTDAQGRVSSGSSLASSDITTALGYTPLNKAGDTMAGALGLNAISSDPSGLTTSDKGKVWYNTTTSQVKYWDGSTAVALGVSGAGLTSLGGQTGSTQTFATGISGSDFSISSSSNTHTFNIPTASATNRGALSSADWTTFNNKLGTATTFSGDVSGAYSSTSVDKIKGTTVTLTSLASGDLLRYNGSAFVNVASLGVANGGTGATSFAANRPMVTNGTGTALTAFTCSQNQALGFDASGNATCMNVTSSGGFLNGGNSFNANATLGLTDSYNLGFITANSTRMTIDSTGKIGIGTTTPVTKLEVVGGIKIGTEASSCSVSFAGTLRYNSGNVEYCNGSSWQAFGISGAGLTSLGGQTGSTQTFATGTSGSDFSISSSSNTHTFNIPTASSANRGALSSADWTTFNNKLGTATTFSGDVSGAYSSTSVDKIKGTTVTLTSLTSGDLLRYNGSAFVNVASLGISNGGTNSVTALNSNRLMISSSGAIVEASAMTDGQVVVGKTGSAPQLVSMTGDVTISNTGVATLKNTGTAGTYAKVTTDAQGRVSSGSSLVSSDITTALGYTPVNKAGDTMSGTLNLASNGLVVGTSQLVVSGGSIGINTASPSSTYKLDVSGDIRATGFYYSSDRRLKYAISDIKGLETILSLHGVKFRWRSNNSPEVGLIAQEVEKVLPELVATDPATGLKAVKYGNIVAPLIESVRELYDMNAEVKRGLASQESKIETLEVTVQKLKEENSEMKRELEEIKRYLKGK